MLSCEIVFHYLGIVQYNHLENNTVLKVYYILIFFECITLYSQFFTKSKDLLTSKNTLGRFPKNSFVLMRHYFSLDFSHNISDKKKITEKSRSHNCCPSFHILAKTRPSYGYDFLTLHRALHI